MAEEVKKQAAAGPPEGVAAIGGTLLIDAENGKSMAITLFASEERSAEPTKYWTGSVAA